MSTKQTPRRRTPAPTFRLSGLERMLLTLYHTVPAAVRADVGHRLYHAWTHPPIGAEADMNEHRYRAATVRFKTGTLPVTVLDDIQAGDVIDTAGGPR